MKYIQRLMAVPKLPERLKRLEELAYNLYWTWNYEVQDLFRMMDPVLWYDQKRSPIKFLRRVSQQRLFELDNDEEFVERLERVLGKFDSYMKRSKAWISKEYPDRAKDQVAYFCAEYGLHESFPIYSGGLGVLAGDHLKTASDLGMSFVAVGLLYRQGYFSQMIDKDGWQSATFPAYDFEDLPVRPARDPDGQEIHVNVVILGKKVWAKVWECKVGTVLLYLLDTDVDQNSLDERKITAQLYGGGTENRIKQEMLLGIGGVRALRLLGIGPTVWHMNEGHAAFLSLERIRELIQGKGLDWETAIEFVRASSVFTTHTPVPAGNDVFSMDLVERHFQGFWDQLGVTRDEFLQLGTERLADGRTHYGMTVLALRLSALSNGVSKLHGTVSRKMWDHIFEDLPAVEVPITHVTNGVHIWTWLNKDMKALFDRYLPKHWEESVYSSSVWDAIDKIPDDELWNAHMQLKKRLRSFVQTRLRRQRRRLGETVEDLAEVDRICDESTLTIGFARRFATYKRASIIFKDIERLKAILNNPERPVQIIFSGKAHPADNPAKELMKKIYEMSRMPEFKNHIVILENYDMNVARHLISSCDIWMNTPRRPHEASGTSGQKAAMNGCLNFSTMDGWWVEGFNQDNGWAIGDDRDYDDEELQDRIDSVSIYTTLEREIVPLYYQRDEDGIPREWVKRMKESMKTVSSQFNTHRMLIDYAQRLYFKSSELSSFMEDNDFQKSKEIAQWKQHLTRYWGHIRVKPNLPASGVERSIIVGEKIRLSTNVYLGELDPDDVKVEVFLATLSEEGSVDDFATFPMNLEKSDVHGEYVYLGEFSIPQEGRIAYTVRVVPNYDRLPDRYFFTVASWA